MRSMIALTFSMAVFAGRAGAETYQIDPVHSDVRFSVSHMVGKVSGRFGKFEGTVEYAKGDPKTWKVDALIETASIDTNNEDRDKHLRAADFLETDKYPTISFKSTKVAGLKGEKAKLHGDLTLHGVSKPVVLDLELGGVVKDPWGKQRAGATATTKINRKDYGIVWNKVLDGGGLVVGEEISITLEIEGILKK